MSVFILLSRRRGFRCTQTRIGGGHRRDRGFQLSTTSMLEKFQIFHEYFFHILIVSRIVPSVLPAIFAIELYKNPKILFFSLSKRFERRGADRKFLASDDGCQLLANVIHFTCQNPTATSSVSVRLCY